MADLLIGRSGAIPSKKRPPQRPAAPAGAPRSFGGAGFSRPIDVGDRVPNFLLPNQRREVDPLYVITAGKPVLMHLVVGAGEEQAAGVRHLADRHNQLSERGIDILALSVAGLEDTVALAEKLSLPFELLADPQARIRQRLGLGNGSGASAKGQPGAPITLALNPGLFVLGRFDDGDAVSQIEKAHWLLPQAKPDLPSAPIMRAAPALLIPNVLDQEMCDRLIEEWKADNADGVTLSLDEQGREQKNIQYGTKRRRDHYIHDKKLLAKLNTILFERVAPQIVAAYDSDITGIEEFKVTCYSADQGGYFRPHRDNNIPGRAQRRFAMSLNLNDGFEGGDLRFPEFGPETYRPPAGGAGIFSCSLLHEVTDMTAGKRFTLLTFLTDATGDRRRAECRNWFESEGRALEKALAKTAAS